MRFARWVVIGAVLGGLASTGGWAAPDAPPAAAPSAGAPAASTTGTAGSDAENAQSTPKKAPLKAGRKSDRDAEGSEAPDRFKAETIIKSQYKLDGQELEVDPD